MKIYKEVGNDWIDKNYFVIMNAHKYNISLCGSIGASIATKKPNKIPGDIDFVTSNIDDALEFSSFLYKKLSQYRLFYKVLHNSKTTFCPEHCNYHIRINCMYWLPICIFVIDKCSSWKFKNKYPIQKPREIQKHADNLNEKTDKKRIYIDENYDENDINGNGTCNIKDKQIIDKYGVPIV
jgi:hypothetical protein